MELGVQGTGSGSSDPPVPPSYIKKPQRAITIPEVPAPPTPSASPHTKENGHIFPENLTERLINRTYAELQIERSIHRT